MQLFFKDECSYGDWLDDHPEGFVLNADTKGPKQSILHNARCRWIYPLKSHVHYTDNFRKVCDDDRRILEQWAADNGHTLTDCQKCLT